MISNEKHFSIDRVVIQGFKRIKDPLELDLTQEMTILVGDNGVGKTTILEAIHLALSGLYRGEHIRRALSQSLFNREDVRVFLNTTGQQALKALPRIEVEVFLSGGDKHTAELFSGGVNSTGSKQCGFTFSIAFDSDYSSELIEMAEGGPFTSVPIEYYEVRWITFADDSVTPRKLPVRSVMMNPTGDWLSNHSDDRATRSLIDGLTEKQRMTLAQDARSAFDSWNGMDSLKDASAALPAIGIDGMNAIDLAADSGTIDSWKRNIVVRLDSIPYGHIGAGSQSMMQAALALGKQRPEKTTLLLFEEPENHLSHANLNKLIRHISEGAHGRKIVITTHSSFVANVLGLEHLQIVGGDPHSSSCSPLTSLDYQTLDFFKKLPGYDTLRLVLSRASILVEGPSDELIVQLAYRQAHEGKLPIEDGIDVISVGSGFLRFLELAKAISKPVLVLTDNDGKPDSLRKKYEPYGNCGTVKIGFVERVYSPEDPDGVDPEHKLNWNTLEAEMLRKNGADTINTILGKSCSSKAELLKYMENNKTDTALAMFNADDQISIPDYISDGLAWIDGQR